MKTLSHKYLAEHIAGQYLRGFSMLEKNAYIYGAIAPDVNKVTYLHGWKGNKKFFGHNYENSSQTMDHLIKKLERSTPGGGIYFYRLGKLTHYIADSFTHVHNGYFTGSLAEHVQYESALHKCLLEQIPFQKMVLPTFDVKALHEHHDTYADLYPSVEIDLLYISSMVLAATFCYADRPQYVGRILWDFPTWSVQQFPRFYRQFTTF